MVRLGRTARSARDASRSTAGIPDLSLGSAFFHHYQSLPQTLTAYSPRATGMGDQTAYLWILYLLLALWPIAIYWSARLLGWSRVDRGRRPQRSRR